MPINAVIENQPYLQNGRPTNFKFGIHLVQLCWVGSRTGSILWVGSLKSGVYSARQNVAIYDNPSVL